MFVSINVQPYSRGVALILSCYLVLNGLLSREVKEMEVK